MPFYWKVISARNGKKKKKKKENAKKKINVGAVRALNVDT